MKKIIIIGLTLLLLTGCGATDKEKEDMFYKSLEKAYTSIYASEGVGLAVYDKETIKIDGEDWYQVASSDYKKLTDLTSLASDVYSSKIAKEINDTINKKYKEADNGIYTLSEGGCPLKYQLGGGTLSEDIKKDVKISKISGSKIVFEYDGKEYEAKKSKDNYVFDDKIFTCITAE